MKRIILLSAVALVTFFVIYLLKNPDEFNKLWLYVIGLSGTAIQFGKMLIDKIHQLLTKVDIPETKPLSRIIKNQPIQDLIKLRTAKS